MDKDSSSQLLECGKVANRFMCAMFHISLHSSVSENPRVLHEAIEDAAPPLPAVAALEQPPELPVVEAGVLQRGVAQDVRDEREVLVVDDEVEDGALGARHGEPLLERHLVARDRAPGEARGGVPRVHPPGGVEPVGRELEVAYPEESGGGGAPYYGDAVDSRVAKAPETAFAAGSRRGRAPTGWTGGPRAESDHPRPPSPPPTKQASPP